MFFSLFSIQIGTSASWYEEANQRKRATESDPKQLQRYMESFFPDRQLMSLQVFGPKVKYN